MGVDEGSVVGCLVGALVGCTEGASVGLSVGWIVGLSEGATVGTIGLKVGGLVVGAFDGSGVPHKLFGGSTLRVHTCCFIQSIPLDILE